MQAQQEPAMRNTTWARKASAHTHLPIAAPPWPRATDSREENSRHVQGCIQDYVPAKGGQIGHTKYLRSPPPPCLL